jgi:tetrapyrrole methylase family protein/MazG family protein
LRSVVAKLRAPEGGCPWDLEQTHATLKRFLLEEAYEALDALDGGRPDRIAEELGDLLMQVVLHAQVAEDSGEFAIEDVIGAIAAKLVRRHPHVFGELAVTTSREVLRNWDELKKSERGDEPLLAAVPKAMPALAQARSVQQRASTGGLHLDRETPLSFAAVLSQVARTGFDADALGELLFDIVAIARERDIDAEESLRMAVRRFRDGVSRLEASRREASANG